jgi:hypothetical protein
MNLENKIDIVTTRLNSESTQGCCDCKSREVLVYKELKDYLETKFTELSNKFESEERTVLKNHINDTFEICRNDIIDNLQTIITNLSISNIQNDTSSSFCTNYILEHLKNELIEHKLSFDGGIIQLYENINMSIEDKLHKLTALLDRVTKETGSKFTQIESRFVDVDGKLNSIYFENQLIKHQLSLEDDIRKTIDEVNDLSKMINIAIKQMDEIKLN